MCCAAQFSIRSFPIPCANGALPSFTSQPLSAGCSVPPLSAYSARPGISCDARHGVGGRRCAIFAGAQRVHVHYVAAHSDTPGSAFLRLSGAAGFTPATRQSKIASLISTGTPTTGIKKPAPKGRQPRVGPRSTRTDVCAPCQRVRFAVSRLAQLRPGFGLERVRLLCRTSCGYRLAVGWTRGAKRSVRRQLYLVLSAFWHPNRFPLENGLRRNTQAPRGLCLRSEVFNDVFSCHGRYCAESRTACQHEHAERKIGFPHAQLLTRGSDFRTLHPCRNATRPISRAKTLHACRLGDSDTTGGIFNRPTGRER